jgi:hypothetical protein
MTHPTPRRRLLFGALALGLGATTITGAAATATATTATAAAATAAAAGGAPTVHVRIDAQRQVSMPDRLRPGVHRFVVRSAKGSSFQIVRARAGYTKREVSRDVGAMFGDPKVLKRFERNVRLFGGVPSLPGQPGVMWAKLPAGHYWVVDTNDREMTPGDIFDLRVGGRSIGGRLGGTATLRAINEVDFAKRPRAIEGSGRLLLRNDSVDNHFFEIAKLQRGKTVQDFRAWIKGAQNGEQAPPPINDKVRSIDSGVISPGLAMSIPYDLPRGRYVVVCWWPDADMGGMPHAFMGMYRGVRVG